MFYPFRQAVNIPHSDSRMVSDFIQELSPLLFLSAPVLPVEDSSISGGSDAHFLKFFIASPMPLPI